MIIMITKINKWGNGLGIRIKKSLADELGIEAGSEVEITHDDGKLVVKPKPKFKMTIEWLCEGLENVRLEDEWGDIIPVGKERFWEEE